LTTPATVRRKGNLRGGNGITFSLLAAQLIGDLIAGSTSELAADFALDRDGRSIGR
jgi:glycine/D-amino acid oxidase-like deaminating enzyme